MSWNRLENEDGTPYSKWETTKFWSAMILLAPVVIFFALFIWISDKIKQHD